MVNIYMYIRRVPMAKDASFDIVSEVNTEEVKN
ncbi:YajQ family cyclic di-GMP-binding protein, partial [Enterococcus faecium]